MQYFTEQALTHREAVEKIRQKYGEQAKIMTHRTIRMGGFFGLFTQEGIEVSGYLSQDPVRKKSIDLEEEKKKILTNLKSETSVKNEATLNEVLKEVREIKERVAAPDNGKRQQHAVISKMEQLLKQNDFTVTFIREVTERIKRTFSLEELDNEQFVENSVIEWIGEKVSILREQPAGGTRIFILVGPTGVGKTTTIAKLAAVYGIANTESKP
ncbi:MAG: flagellar biosynthesis protein FlhF, partial [Spirochaetota bacterium]